MSFQTKTNIISSTGQYATEATVGHYIENTKGPLLIGAWDAMCYTTRTAYVQEAQYLIEDLDWKGCAVSVDQHQVFPRQHLCNRNGGAIAHTDGTNDLVPIEVHDAIAETALWLSQENRAEETYYEGTSLQGVGSVKTNRRAKQPIPRSVWRMLKHLLNSSGQQLVVYRV